MTVGQVSKWLRPLPLAALLVGAQLAAGGAGLLAQEDSAAETPTENTPADEFIIEDDLDAEPEFFEFDSPAEIEELLSEEWRVFAGEAQPSYEPGNRRDPFRSLIIDEEGASAGHSRPDGVPGLLIGDLEVTGIIKFGQQTVAQVRAADRPVSYLVREGDRLFDGDVVSIREDEVVFQQIVDDPAALRPFRTVVKKLRPEN